MQEDSLQRKKGRLSPEPEWERNFSTKIGFILFYFYSHGDVFNRPVWIVAPGSHSRVNLIPPIQAQTDELSVFVDDKRSHPSALITFFLLVPELQSSGHCEHSGPARRFSQFNCGPCDRILCIARNSSARAVLVYNSILW